MAQKHLARMPCKSALQECPDIFVVRQGVVVKKTPSQRGETMFDFRDLFQWERFITPSIIKIFYWLAIGMSMVVGLSGALNGLALMLINPFGGAIIMLGSLIGILIGILAARIVAEFVLITFRINEHLGAIRNRGQM